ncbi:hypothetical protein [Hufsiella ginkgonis]|uniref:Uncharacterized protein n=1 Tax=Hufsiella ginkgonis TaxID=2695274 RepID=A0A7K1Y0J4_9SPHI|nr:hypothetical protein [Hufsiella ginkgonis]MXV16750.1 hypothetical protein [Hufsiella ginkgonis]
MATLKTIPHTTWGHSPVQITSSAPNSYRRYLAYADAQQPYHAAWWLVSLLAHSCFLVPLSFLLIYSMGGPVMLFLGASMGLFFANIVANMSGALTRTTIFLFFLSLVMHAGMIGFTLLTAA